MTDAYDEARKAYLFVLDHASYDVDGGMEAEMALCRSIDALRAERDAAMAERDKWRAAADRLRVAEEHAETLASRLEDERDSLAKHLSIDLSQDETSRSDDQIFAAHYDALRVVLARVEGAVGPFIKKMANTSLADMDALYELMQEARALASLSDEIKGVLGK
jgi:hypothetical protein